MAIEITQPDKIQNLDALDIVGRLDRVLVELYNCVSATRNESTVPDIGRWKKLLDDLIRKFGIYKGDPELDLPKYHPISRPVPTAPELEIRQNPDVMQQIQLLIALRTEILFSESAERSSSFSDADADRIDKVFEKWGKLLDDVEANPEVDSPNSPDEKPVPTGSRR